jgi:hypothetical protein
MRISAFLASCTDAGYSRSRPAIAWFSPAPTLGHIPILLVDDGFALSPRIPAITVADVTVAASQSAIWLIATNPRDVITEGKKGNP